MKKLKRCLGKDCGEFLLAMDDIDSTGNWHKAFLATYQQNRRSRNPKKERMKRRAHANAYYAEQFGDLRPRPAACEDFGAVGKIQKHHDD
jgi:hypothetical protein